MSYRFKMRYLPRRLAPLVMGAPRNLAMGLRLVAQGRVVDAVGRPSDATITVYRGQTVVGVVRSVAGRFSMFDLAPAAYTYRASGVRGGNASGAFAVNGSVSNITARLQ